jgi:hypothetical protein
MSAFRMGVTFYTVRAIYCALTGDEENAKRWADKGVAMLNERPIIGGLPPNWIRGPSWSDMQRWETQR